MINLPDFNVPELKDRKLTGWEYYLLNMEHIKRLHESGQLNRLMNSSDRVPVDVRFEL